MVPGMHLCLIRDQLVHLALLDEELLDEKLVKLHRWQGGSLSSRA